MEVHQSSLPKRPLRAQSRPLRAVNPQQLLHSFNTIDIDKNGEISREEFMESLPQTYLEKSLKNRPRLH